MCFSLSNSPLSSNIDVYPFKISFSYSSKSTKSRTKSSNLFTSRNPSPLWSYFFHIFLNVYRTSSGILQSSSVEDFIKPSRIIAMKRFRNMNARIIVNEMKYIYATPLFPHPFIPFSFLS